MTQFELVQLAMVIGILLKLALAIIGSFRGWKGWPWLLWWGVEFTAGFVMAILHDARLISSAAVDWMIIGVGSITLCGMIYMACKRRYQLINLPHLSN